jgi:carnitine O-palmitoyltransferase 1
MAYYKDQGRFVQTYEASMTRLYLNGRTETVRSCTSEMVDFVLSMNDPDCDNAERIRRLNKMEEKHTNLYKDAMNGKGVDRHLFALYVACKGLGQESEFLQNVLTMPWTLSTSQTPHTQQTAVPDPNWMSFNNKVRRTMLKVKLVD